MGGSSQVYERIYLRAGNRGEGIRTGREMLKEEGRGRSSKTKNSSFLAQAKYCG